MKFIFFCTVLFFSGALWAQQSKAETKAISAAQCLATLESMGESFNLLSITPNPT